MRQATEAFWRTGFSGTSLDDLSAATGMNRPSLYGAFGDKRALYLATLDRYIDNGRRMMAVVLDREQPVRKVLRQLYEGALSMYLPPGDAALGCFLIGTATAESVSDPEVRAKLGAGLRLFDHEFETRLRHAQAQGEIAADADPAALARIASAILHTLALRSRAGDPPASLRATADAGVQLICGAVPAPQAKARRRT